MSANTQIVQEYLTNQMVISLNDPARIQGLTRVLIFIQKEINDAAETGGKVDKKN